MTIFVLIPLVSLAGSGYIFISYKFKQHVKTVEDSTHRLINIEIERNNQQHLSFGRSGYQTTADHDEGSRNPFTNERDNIRNGNNENNNSV